MMKCKAMLREKIALSDKSYDVAGQSFVGGAVGSAGAILFSVWYFGRGSAGQPVKIAACLRPLPTVRLHYHSSSAQNHST